MSERGQFDAGNSAEVQKFSYGDAIINKINNGDMTGAFKLIGKGLDKIISNEKLIYKRQQEYHNNLADDINKIISDEKLIYKRQQECHNNLADGINKIIYNLADYMNKIMNNLADDTNKIMNKINDTPQTKPAVDSSEIYTYEDLYKLHESGKSYHKIEKLTGIDKENVRYRIRAYKKKNGLN